MNPNNYRYDARFFIGLVTLIACAGILFYSLVLTVATKLGTLAGAVELFCSLVGLWSISNIVGNYFFKFPTRSRLAKNDIQIAVAISATVVVLFIARFWT